MQTVYETPKSTTTWDAICVLQTVLFPSEEFYLFLRCVSALGTAIFVCTQFITQRCFGWNFDFFILFRRCVREYHYEIPFQKKCKTFNQTLQALFKNSREFKDFLLNELHASVSSLVTTPQRVHFCNDKILADLNWKWGLEINTLMRMRTTMTQ